MRHIDNDGWAGTLPLDSVGRWVFTIEALADPYRSWLADLAKRHAAGQDLTSELEEGLALIRAAAARAGGEDARLLTAAARQIERAPGPDTAVVFASEEPQIGRASCRGRGEISVGAVSLKKKKKIRDGEVV